MHIGNQTHIIHKQLIDIHIEDKAMAKAWQNKISAYYKNKILPALEKACDELITPDRHIRIEKLELDLGMIGNGDLRPELTARLVRKFREKILNTSYERLLLVTEENSDKIHIPSGVEVRPEKDGTTYDAIVYFIENGVLPWWCSSKDTNLREGVNELFESGSDQFIKKVWKLSTQSQTCLRIIDLFTEEQLFECFDRNGKYQMKVLFRDFKQIAGTPNLEPVFFSKYLQTVIHRHNPSLDQNLIFMQTDAVVSILNKLGFTLNSLPSLRSKPQVRARGTQKKKMLLFDLLENHLRQAESSDIVIREEKDIYDKPENKVNPNNLDIEENISEALENNVVQQMSEKPSIPDTPGPLSCEDGTTSDDEQINEEDVATSDHKLIHKKDDTTSDHKQIHKEDDAVSDHEQIHKEADTTADHEQIHKEDSTSSDHEQVNKEDSTTSDHEQVNTEDSNSSDHELIHKEDRTSSDHELIHKEDSNSSDHEQVNKEDSNSSDHEQVNKEDSNSSDHEQVNKEDSTSSDHEQVNKEDDTTTDHEQVIKEDSTTSDHRQVNKEADATSDHDLLNKEDEASTKDISNLNLQQRKESTLYQKYLKYDNLRDIPTRMSKSIVPGEGESLEIDNAGVVLLWPYLEMFFKALGLVEDHAFINIEGQARAVQLLHYLVNGNENAEEYHWPLLKLLCGTQIPDFVSARFELTTGEKEESEHLLKAVVRNWKALKNTSPAALQSSFLRRSGLLMHDHNGWIVYIERISIDVLLDKLTWPVSVIKLPWNDYTIHVKW